MHVVTDEPNLLALYLPENSQIGIGAGEWPTGNGKHAWDRGPDSRWQGHGVLHLHRPGDAYAVWVFWRGPDRTCTGWYLNLQEPFTRTAIGIDTLDHELDILVKLDGSWEFKDAELMETCIEQGRLTSDEVVEIMAEGARLGDLLDDGQQWWDSEWATWMPPPELDAPLTLANNWADHPSS